MDDGKLFGLVASLALLIWLVGRSALPGRLGRNAEFLAFGLVGAGIIYALLQTLLWFTRS
jgi:hypothetical protein